MAFDDRLDRAQLDAPVLRDGRHARAQAARQAHEQVLDRRDALVRRREDLRVVGHKGGLLQVALLLAEAEEVLHRDVGVDTALPLRGRPPGELGGFRRGLERFPRVEQRLHVDAVVGNCGHVEYYLSLTSIFPMDLIDNTPSRASYHSPMAEPASTLAAGSVGTVETQYLN